MNKLNATFNPENQTAILDPLERLLWDSSLNSDEKNELFDAIFDENFLKDLGSNNIQVQPEDMNLYTDESEIGSLFPDNNGNTDGLGRPPDLTVVTEDPHCSFEPENELVQPNKTSSVSEPQLSPR